MYSKLPAESGETPTKVVFEGVQSDEDALHKLYVANLGTISAFQSKARQNRVVSDQPGSSMQQALPNGQRLRYTYNNGQETIYVTLTPEEIAEANQPPQPPQLLPCDVLLAIDVLFDPAPFVVGDIYHHVDVTTTNPPADPDPTHPEHYDYSAHYSYNIQYNYDPGSGGMFGNWGFTHPDPSNPGHNFAGYYHPGTFFESVITILTAFSPTTGGGAYSDDPAVHAAADNSHGASTGYSSLLKVNCYGGQISNNLGGDLHQANYYQVIEWYFNVTPKPDGGTTTTTHNYRERRTDLDIFPVVGLRVAPVGKAPERTAISVGDHAGETDALKAVVDHDDIQIMRSIAFAAPADGNYFYGASFVAKATIYPDQGAPDQQLIEVYLASSNVTKHNNPPGLTDSTFAADDSTMLYDVFTSLTYMIQVREITDAGSPPYVVRVSLDAEGKIEQMGPDDVSTVTSTTFDSMARHLDWRFAAGTKKWADGGNQPADPTAKDPDGNSTMGKLLTSSVSDQTVTVAKTTAFSREVPTAPMWTGPVTDMTKVNTITWTPAGTCHVHGKATIDDGGGDPPSPPSPPSPPPDGPMLPPIL